MTKPLIFLGSNANMEMFTYVCKQHDIPVHGIIDDDYYGNTEHLFGIPIVGSEESFDFENEKEKYNFFIAASTVPTVPRDTNKRIKFIGIVNKYNLTCQTLIDKESRVYNPAALGPGCYVGYQAAVTNNSTVGAHSHIHGHAALAHHCTMGINSVLERNSITTGNTHIGDNVNIGLGVMCVNHAGLRIGNNSVVQPGIILMRDVEENEIVSIAGGNAGNDRRIYKNVIRR